MAQHHIPALGSLAPDNDIAQEAARLRQAVTDSQEARREAVDIGNASVNRWRAAQREFQAAAVSNDVDLDAQQALADKVTSLEKLAAHHIITARIEKADSELTRATYAFSMYCRRAGVLDDLIAPLEQEAHDATAAVAEAEAKLRPIRERYNAIQAKIADVTAACHPVGAPGQFPDLSAYRIPSYPALPLPSIYVDGAPESVEVDAPVVAGTVKAEPYVHTARA